MNIASVLIEAAKSELVVPSEILEFPDIANQVVGTKTARKALERYASVPEIYQYATWLCIDNIRAGIEDAGIADTKQAQEKYLSPGGPAVAGMATMVRYLSLLPYVYAKQRSEFSGMPSSIEVQVADLGEIASRSAEHIDLIASQNIGVSGVLERNGYLRSEHLMTTQTRSDDANHAYVLASDKKGLQVQGRFNIHGQITALEKYWQKDHEDQKMRKVGCVMLHLTDPETGATLFDTMWQSLVRLAASDPRYYERDLQEIYQMHKDYDY